MLSFQMKFVILAVCFVAACGANAQIRLNVVSKEFILNNPPFRACHSSSVLAISSGHLMVAFFGGSGEGQKDVSIWLTMKSANHWSEP